MVVSMMIHFGAQRGAVLLSNLCFIIQTADLFFISNRSPKVRTPVRGIANKNRCFAYAE